MKFRTLIPIFYLYLSFLSLQIPLILCFLITDYSYGKKHTIYLELLEKEKEKDLKK